MSFHSFNFISTHLISCHLFHFSCSKFALFHFSSYSIFHYFRFRLFMPSYLFCHPIHSFTPFLHSVIPAFTPANPSIPETRRSAVQEMQRRRDCFKEPLPPRPERGQLARPKKQRTNTKRGMQRKGPSPLQKGKRFFGPRSISFGPGHFSWTLLQFFWRWLPFFWTCTPSCWTCAPSCWTWPFPKPHPLWIDSPSCVLVAIVETRWQEAFQYIVWFSASFPFCPLLLYFYSSHLFQPFGYAEAQLGVNLFGSAPLGGIHLASISKLPPWYLSAISCIPSLGLKTSPLAF